MRHYKLFQAWQDQNKEYTDFITKAIKCVADLQREKNVDIEIVRYPAQDEAGSPDVVSMVWEQISNCDLFVGDVTSIYHHGNKEISNPNVMYEVGIADAILGEKRVILVCSKETDINLLAFDVNHKRISPLSMKNQKAIACLNEWIEAAIRECDIQNIQRDFVFKDTFDDLFVVYNNLMRMIFFDDNQYSIGTVPPSMDIIQTRLAHSAWSELMISVDYQKIISRLKTLIQELYHSNDRRYISEIIEIYESLDKYNWFMQSVKKDVAFQKLDYLSDAVLQYAKAFYLTSANGVDNIYGSILFDEKYVYINNMQPFQNVFLREMFTDEIKVSCHMQNVQVDAGALTGIKMLTYSVKKDAINTIAMYMKSVLDSIFCFMDKLNFYPNNYSDDLKCNTIITWCKSC